MRNSKWRACLAFSALVTFVSLTQVHAEPDCPQAYFDQWAQLREFYNQVDQAIYPYQDFSSSCTALDAADKVYEVTHAGKIDGKAINKPELGESGVKWLDCDWVLKTLAPQAKLFEKEHPEFEQSKNTWWRKQITLCENYPTPQGGYRVSKIYSGIEGLQLALYKSNNINPPILAFAGTQDFTDAKASLKFGAPQIREFLELKGSITPEEPWHLIPGEGQRQNDLDHKLRMKTSQASESLVEELARSIANGGHLVITGHSLGGALAQASAYLIQKRATELAPNTRRIVQVYTWNGLGGAKGLKSLGVEIDPAIFTRLQIHNYRVKGDLVPALGPQLPGKQHEIDNQHQPGFLDSLAYQKQPVKYHSIETIQKLYGRDRCRGFREK